MALPFKNADNEVCFNFQRRTTHADDPSLNQNYTTVYNYSTREIIKDTISQLVAVSISTIINKERLLGTGEHRSSSQNSVLLVDALTNETIWEQTNGAIGSAGAIMNDDYIYHGSSDINQTPTVKKRHSDTGNLIWETPAVATSSLIYLHNDVVYYAFGNLTALDAETGETLLSIESPDRDVDDGAFFSRGMAVDAETGRIYAGTYRSLICYEGLR